MKKHSKKVKWNRPPRPCKVRASAKAKGRNGCIEVRDLLLKWLPLKEEDLYVKTGSAGGVDVWLSANALKAFPFAIEVKNQESLNIWAALQQAQNNALGLPPIVFFKRSRTPMFVALKADDFLKLLDS